MPTDQAISRQAFYDEHVGRERMGELIRRYRGERSQSWLSAQLINRGLQRDQGAISAMELGKREVDMNEAALFAEILAIPRDEIALALTAEYEIARNLVVGSAKDARAISDVQKTLARRHKR